MQTLLQTGMPMKPERVSMLLKLPANTREAIKTIAAVQHRSANAAVNVAIERHIREAKK